MEFVNDRNEYDIFLGGGGKKIFTPPYRILIYAPAQLDIKIVQMEKNQFKMDIKIVEMNIKIVQIDIEPINFEHDHFFIAQRANQYWSCAAAHGPHSLCQPYRSDQIWPQYVQPPSLSQPQCLAQKLSQPNRILKLYIKYYFTS